MWISKISKSSFIRRCAVTKKYEAYKVWAQWLIRNLCQNHDNYHLIPNTIHIKHDNDVRSHLCEKGVDLITIDRFYSQTIHEVDQLYTKYNQFKYQQLTTPALMESTCQQIHHTHISKKGKEYHMYYLGTLFVKYNHQTYNRLLLKYKILNTYLISTSSRWDSIITF